MFSDPAASLYWPPDVARYDMETLLFSSSGWLRTTCIVLALFWVAVRAYQVLSQPVETLVHVLGLEVPVAPLVSLAGIKADGVLLHWKSPERASVLRYVIRINGIDVGHVAPHDTSATIENLQPARHYTIRVVTFNSSNFQAPSAPIRLRTLPADSDQHYAAAPPAAHGPATDDDDANPPPVVRPNKSLADVATPFAAPLMSREHSNSTARQRPGIARRSSPASQTADDARAATDSSDSIRALTEKLDALRRDLDDMDRQIQDEDQDAVTQRLVLVDRRDEKKAALKEKEDASRDLRKEVATLERQSAAAQTRRTHQERLFRQKEAERKKLKDDTAKWSRESVELRATAAKMREEQEAYKEASQKRIQDAKDRYEEETQANKLLEDAIREKGIQIKALEEERKQLEDGQDGGEAPDGTDNAEREEDNRWKMTLGLLQQQYAQAWQLFTEADRANQEATNRLQYLQQRRLSQPQLYDDPAVPRVGPARGTGQRQRPLSMREGMLSAPGGFVQTSSAPFNSMTVSSSPPFASVTPYFNPVNGMALPPRGHGHTISFSQMSQADLESLTGGAPMSPTAGALLPAGLFGDDLGLTDSEHDDLIGPPRLYSLEPSPNTRNVLPGLGALGHANPPSDQHTPVSPPESPSPSVLASPRESGPLQFFPNPENIDPDKRSIQSSSSSFMNSQSRFGGLFGLNRQRGKTISGQGPALGSLKPSQSQSLPRQEFGLDAVGSSRRRGSTEGAWYDSFIRTKTQPAEASSSPKAHVPTRKRTFNMFGTRNDPWLTSVLGTERPSSPRQGSTKSGEGMVLPRPSTESQTRFGWGVDAFGARSSPLGVDWSVNNTNTSSWSRMPSRRPSVQHGSTTNLAVNEDSMHDDILDFPSNVRSPMQAPIGTRPQSSASHMPRDIPPLPGTPPTALNPAAAAFTLTLGLGKKSEEEKAKRAAEKEAKRAEKAEKKEKTKAERCKGKEKEKQVAFDPSADGSHPASPHEPFPRPSRDTPSIISTADASEASPRESLERSVSQATSDHTGSVGKESFMQKLTRKGSTSQFLSFGKKNPLFAKKGEVPGTPDAADELDGSSGFFGKSVDGSNHNSPSLGTPKDKGGLLGWGSIKRIGRKDKTPSLHESIASEATGDEDVADEGHVEGLGLKA
ncbi:uncharacterized protein M421DRAFT_222697 [Didymella exigua CBS 183.55]|uniref:Fibronectin type-III domain-containing protein n=1 Tax=Didymella exigua CBS 183.55 TaxID=1150837 RepID=A0A6A5RGP5_9PLEO|nr:uncharacterized protein M421DRAFT_222697 [Didymella exigua CBS 183.55]KAF1926308.1 hypothetical protein M421DRAFT_222697 [Didymella exigua CBS 183.55]